jgi:ribosomal-protein-alanine N-acetyltransferase
VTTALPALETERLVIRPFVLEDLAQVHRVLSNAWAIPGTEQPAQLPTRERWLRWAVANEAALAELSQPPLGDRAVLRKADGCLIGSVGLVPALGPFGLLPGFPAHQGSRSWFLEVGLFWAIDPAHQGQGYATEAARALIERAVAQFRLGRFVATTEFDNVRSLAVMRKLGMRILNNPEPEPAWFQAVGVLEPVVAPASQVERPAHCDADRTQ